MDNDISNKHEEKPCLHIGCALLPKKVSRYLTPLMRETAKSKGIKLSEIDSTRSLHDQGPFDAIIHKLRPSTDWERNLLDYVQTHPNVKVIDKVDGIRTLQNRSTMLSPLSSDIVVQPSTAEDGHKRRTRVAAPVQVEIPEGISLSKAESIVTGAGLTPPLLAKPLWTDGREGCHGLAVIHDTHALRQVLLGGGEGGVKPPLVIQQYYEHGGVLYKVYVLGNKTVVMRRPSIGKTHLRGSGVRSADGSSHGWVTRLPRVSCQTKSPRASLEDIYANPHLPPPPPDWLSAMIAKVFRKHLGLQLFNFDLIVPEKRTGDASHKGVDADDDEELYYVVDINYFPGVDKIPKFEIEFVDFLLSACNGGVKEKQDH